MEKIKVSRELAEALDSVMNQYPDHEKLLRLHVETKTGAKIEWGGDWKPINKLSAVELSKILIYGYEVEETPEEHLSRLYLFPPKYLWVDNTHRSVETRIKIAYRDGIEIALKLMEVEVKGIHK